jgi:hypothetical protein
MAVVFVRFCENEIRVRTMCGKKFAFAKIFFELQRYVVENQLLPLRDRCHFILL